MAVFSSCLSTGLLGYVVAGGVEGWLDPTRAWITGTALAVALVLSFALLITERRR